MEQREEQEREREATRKLQRHLDKVGSPPRRLRRKYNRGTVVATLLVLAALLIFFWIKMSAIPDAGTNKVYPDQNGNLRKPGAQ